MTALTPSEAGRWAALSGIPLPPDRWADVAATATHIQAVVSVLRELDLTEAELVAGGVTEEAQHSGAC